MVAYTTFRDTKTFYPPRAFLAPSVANFWQSLIFSATFRAPRAFSAPSVANFCHFSNLPHPQSSILIFDKPLLVLALLMAFMESRNSPVLSSSTPKDSRNFLSSPFNDLKTWIGDLPPRLYLDWESICSLKAPYLNCLNCQKQCFTLGN